MEDLAVSLPDIRALVAERQRFDDWLVALEARRAETPARVFDRVHADYVARRDAVSSGLHAHVGSLEALANDLDGRLQHVQSQLAEREDARAEGILRTAVGEFNDDQWETTRQDVETQIAQLEDERQKLIGEAEDVSSLLSSARPPAPEPEPEPEPEPLVVASVPDVEAELVSSNVASAIAHADPAAVEHTIDLNVDGEEAPAVTAAPTHDDMNTTDPYLRAVRRNAEAEADIESAFAVSEDEFQALTEAEDAAPSANAYHAANNGTPAAAEFDRDHEANAAIDALGGHVGSTLPDALDEIDVFGEPVTAPRANTTDYVPPRSNNDPYAPRTHATEAPAQQPPQAAAPKRDGFDDLAFLRSVTTDSASTSGSATRANGATDQAKTLRCTECGTMNFPTEWYCERCGGELATF